jgi:predicted transcriptional regulator of viral defense system
MSAQRPLPKKLLRALSRGVLRARDAGAFGVTRAQLSRWVEDGALDRVGRGLYALPDRELDENESLVHVAKRVDGGIICLLSALRFHNLTTQNPSEVWVAIPRSTRAPHLDWPPLRVIRWSGAVLTEGIEQRKVGGGTIRITSPPRTVADCFKHRNTVGIDVAIEALRDYRRQKVGSLDQLMAAAAVCRMQRVIQPYVEAIT